MLHRYIYVSRYLGLETNFTFVASIYETALMRSRILFFAGGNWTSVFLHRLAILLQ